MTKQMCRVFEEKIYHIHSVWTVYVRLLLLEIQNHNVWEFLAEKSDLRFFFNAISVKNACYTD